jgi:hypothetical protein
MVAVVVMVRVRVGVRVEVRVGVCPVGGSESGSGYKFGWGTTPYGWLALDQRRIATALPEFSKYSMVIG